MSYTITPGPSGADYIITFSDGRVLVIDAMGFPGMSRLDGAADGVIDIYGLLANADASTNLTAEFMSASGAAFTVTAGGREDDYLITFADGRVLVVDAQNLSQLDSLDGVTDTVIDVDGLIANSDPTTGAIAEFTSSSGAAFTVAISGGDSDYIITFADGRVFVVDFQSLSQLDSLDGVTNNVIDVDGLIANSDRQFKRDGRVYKRLRSRFHRSAWPSRHVLYHHLCRWPHFVG